MSDQRPDGDDRRQETRSRGRPRSHSRQDTSTARNEAADAARLGELVRELESLDDIDELLEVIVHAAVGMVPGAEEGSMSELRQRRTVVHRAASGAVAKLVDALMTEIGEGPCLDAAFGDRVIRVDDMTADGRWPTFTARAAEAGVRSMLSFPLYVQDNDLGALNLYAATPNAFTDEAEHLGLIFATHAAITIAGAQRLGQLQGALASREVIGQAVGILIERHGIDTARAFATLVRYSQDTNRKLRDVAADIVRSALARNERGSKG